ncbi:conserved domain protein [Hyphomonas neptunium ATCC 15444]|uniref:Conserved domain protein n=2 Tax=Hyphomonas TaxID=85 RepID=Q0C4I4_HYPNA|nr:MULTISPECIES: DUF4167 domain-containing protein [Hyphomonas]ABI75760.1 conserved domain protein [Hyphomonas neptunium ATCC 15444]KCZ96429.1 hypothetical protein HHI_02080 [Hyphomonas hirschiana VP5]
MKRSRGRNRRSGGNPQNAFNNPNRHYESVGPDVKIRGSAQQVLEKYLQYARDAQTSGDRILSEAYFQFAEHYQRIVAKQTEARVQQPQQNQQNQQNRGDRRDDRDNRPNGDRDYRGNQPSDGADNQDEDAGEAVVTSTVPRHDDENQRDTQRDTSRDSQRADSLRVIDADDDGDEASSEEADEVSAQDALPPERDRSERAPRANTARRKPYKPREDRAPRQKDDAAGEPAAETDGVMKTLSRGRRRPAVEEGASTETTD